MSFAPESTNAADRPRTENPVAETPPLAKSIFTPENLADFRALSSPGGDAAKQAGDNPSPINGQRGGALGLEAMEKRLAEMDADLKSPEFKEKLKALAREVNEKLRSLSPIERQLVLGFHQMRDLDPQGMDRRIDQIVSEKDPKTGESFSQKLNRLVEIGKLPAERKALADKIELEKRGQR